MNIILKTTLLVASVLSVTACNLDKSPSVVIAVPGPDQSFRTFDDAAKFANGMNSMFRDIQYGLFAYTPEVQTDMYNASTTYGNRNGNPHVMGTNFNASDYNIRDIWRQCYTSISSYNNFLYNAEKVEFDAKLSAEDLAAQQYALQAYKGYAHFYRAFTYLYLVQCYAQDYEPATAATALGVPKITEVNFNDKPARATLAEITTLITEDIATAKTLLAEVAGEVRTDVPTIDVVKALEARLNLYTHQYAEAAAVAQELIGSGKYALANSAETMTKEWLNDAGTEDIMQLYATLSEFGSCLQGAGSANTRLAMDIYLNYSNNLKKYVPDFIPTKTCIDMYEDGDLRLGTWFKTFDCVFNSVPATITLLNKYTGNPLLFTAPARNYAQKAKVFRIAEMYLIRAEALLSQPAPDAGGATATLNELQNARKATATPATMDVVKNEWAKETIGEGFRLFCLKRWNQGFSGRVPQDENVVQPGGSFTEIVVPANTTFFTWGIPTDEMKVNTNLIQNSGW